MNISSLRYAISAGSIILSASLCFAQTTKHPQAKVSFDDFKKLTEEVEQHRSKRLIDLDTFLKMSKEAGVIILDTRSAMRFDRVHLKGAKNLPFTDFTQASLAEVIPDPNTVILIYCNNNFDGNQVDFTSKEYIPTTRPTPSGEMKDQAKPLMMALNIPTYINLFGYGYRNVYELDELVHINDPRIELEGSTVRDIKPLILAPSTK